MGLKDVDIPNGQNTKHFTRDQIKKRESYLKSIEHRVYSRISSTLNTLVSHEMPEVSVKDTQRRRNENDGEGKINGTLQPLGYNDNDNGYSDISDSPPSPPKKSKKELPKTNAI